MIFHKSILQNYHFHQINYFLNKKELFFLSIKKIFLSYSFNLYFKYLKNLILFIVFCYYLFNLQHLNFSH